MHTSVDIAPTKTLFDFILFFVKKQWVKFTFITLFWLAYSVDQAVFPLLFGKIIDGFASYAGDRSQAWAVLCGPILAAILFWVCIEVSFRAGGLLMAFTFPRLEKQIRMYLFSYLQNQSVNYFSAHFTGNITTKISDMVDNMSHVLNLTLTLFIPAIGGVLLAIFTFSQLSPFFGALLAGWALIHIGISVFFGLQCSHYSYIHSETRSRLNGRLVDSLSHYLAVKLFANKSYELKYVGALQKEERSQNQYQLLYTEKVRFLISICAFSGPGLAINTYAYWSWVNHLISVGDIVRIFNTSWNIVIMLWWTSIELPNFFREIGVCRQALSLLQEPLTVTDLPAAKPLQVSEGKIEFKDVHFHYKGTTPLFTNKSVVIEPGQKVGLVGYSGSGKSTFVNLILRLFDIQSGRILIDGQDISKVTQTSLRGEISVIPQEPSLFHRTLMENIRYGRVDASDAEIIEAAKQAHAHDFIMALSQGYETLAGERGVSISGGQRQRIAIARAILKNSSLLILDEATSALDARVEAKIQESFVHLMQGKTTLVIAHKLSTLLTMDRILVFDKGKIVEDGTHKSLLAKGGIYKTLWETQVDGFLPPSPMAHKQ